jgi:hypothetical protein
LGLPHPKEAIAAQLSGKQDNSLCFELRGFFMLTIKPELEQTLKKLAQQEHISLDEIIKRLISLYAKHKQPSGLLVDNIKDLPEISAFAGQDPLEIQKQMHDETLMTNQQAQAKQELWSLMAKIPRSVSLADELIQDRRLEAKREQQDQRQ